MINKVKEQVFKLLKNDKSGHDKEHVLRVYKTSLEISKNYKCNREVVQLIALLHDVDDYKLFGLENEKNLINAKTILNSINISDFEKQCVLDGISKIGYSKRISGIVPDSIESKIVSDADMLDALGVNGILRAVEFGLCKKQEFFNKDIWPIESFNSNIYKNKKSTTINHFFEKLLKLKNLMLTCEGKNLAKKKHEFMVDFLREYFIENEAFDWIEYLNRVNN